jgi:hypothetical protein
MRQVAAGDGPAFAELFRRRHPVVFRFALHMTGSVSTAEDVVQDVFLIVMRDAVRYAAGREAGCLLVLPPHALALLVAFVPGAVIVNSAIMELPSDKDGRCVPFMFGGVIDGLILLPLG